MQLFAVTGMLFPRLEASLNDVSAMFRRKLFFLIYCSILGLIASTSSAGEIYRSVDERGRVTYSDTPQAGSKQIPITGQPGRQLQPVAHVYDGDTIILENGKRIRLQGLPNLSKPGKTAQETMGSWPTYRVSQSQMRTMQHRLWDCFRQMRWPQPDYLSDGITALTLYLNKQADGGELTVPSIKR